LNVVTFDYKVRAYGINGLYRLRAGEDIAAFKVSFLLQEDGGALPHGRC